VLGAQGYSIKVVGNRSSNCAKPGESRARLAPRIDTMVDASVARIASPRAGSSGKYFVMGMQANLQFEGEGGIVSRCRSGPMGGTRCGVGFQMPVGHSSVIGVSTGLVEGAL